MSLTRPYKPLGELISLNSIESRFFSHKGIDFEITYTQAHPHLHTVKNCDTGKSLDMLHSKLLELSHT
jgi:hypothetical protein